MKDSSFENETRYPLEITQELVALVLDVVKKELPGGSLLTPLLDNDASAADNLDGVALGIVLAEAGPLTKSLGVGGGDQVDLVVLAQSGDKLLVGSLVDGVGQHTQLSLSAVEGLDGLVETTGEPIVVQRRPKHLLEGAVKVEGCLFLGDFGHGHFFLVLVYKSTRMAYYLSSPSPSLPAQNRSVRDLACSQIARGAAYFFAGE